MLGVTPAPRQKIDDYTLGGGITEHRFNPYKDNGGTTAAIAGDDFAIIASDTRLTNGGYGIVSRNQSKLFQLNEKMVLGATGCWADVLTLTKLCEARIQVTHFVKVLLRLGIVHKWRNVILDFFDPLLSL